MLPMGLCRTPLENELATDYRFIVTSEIVHPVLGRINGWE